MWNYRFLFDLLCCAVAGFILTKVGLHYGVPLYIIYPCCFLMGWFWPFGEKNQ